MTFLAWLSGSPVGEWVGGSTWAYPGLLFIRTLGHGVLVGLNSAVGLRLLGFAPRVPVADMELLFPYMWLGFWVNAVSGSVLFIADAPKNRSTLRDRSEAPSAALREPEPTPSYP